MNAPAPATAATRRRRTGVAVLAALIAASAWFGMFGLMVGFLGLPEEQEQRLPFNSPVFGGLALAVVVAIPSSVLAWSAWRGDPRTDQIALTAGVLLVGWILTEYLVIRELSFLHPTYLFLGVVLIWIGRPAMGRT